MQLSQDSIKVLGRYSMGKSVVDRVTGKVVPLPVGLHIDGEALEDVVSGGGISSSRSSSSSQARVEGLSDNLNVELMGNLTNFNTIEEFKKADKGAILKELGQQLLKIIETDEEPLQKLNSFTVLSFADLKKFKFIYWFAYPALLARPSWSVSSEWKDVVKVYSTEQVSWIAASIV